MPAYDGSGGTGNVIASASIADNSIVRGSNGTTGIQDSALFITDFTGDVTGPVETSNTSAAGEGFTNQPAGDTVQALSSNAGDTTQQVTFIYELAGVVSIENKNLNGTTAVTSTATMTTLLGVVLNGATVGTVTIRKTTGALTITTLAPAVLSKGVFSFSAASAYGRTVTLVASGATTKKIGIGGFDTAGATQYGLVTLTGTTAINSSGVFGSVLQLYTGDLEVTRTVTVATHGGVSVNTATILNTTSSALGTASFLDVTGTLPAVPVNSVNGVNIQITGAGVAAQNERAINVQLNAGYTGAANTLAARIVNFAAGTNNDAFGGSANVGIQGATVGSTTGHNIAGTFNASGGVQNVGVRGAANTSAASTTTIGGMFLGRNTSGTAQIGAFASLNANAPAYFSTALMADNSDQAVPIFVARDSSAILPTTGPTAVFAVLDGAQPQNGLGVLTSGTMTAETQGQIRSTIHSYTWTNAMVTALGASLTGDITVCTLPAKTVVLNAYVVILTAAGGVTTLTVALGRTSAAFIDYIVASDAKAAANTVYGDASGERGTNLTGYDLPSYTGTTAVSAHFISTGTNLNTVTTSTGRIILETILVP